MLHEMPPSDLFSGNKWRLPVALVANARLLASTLMALSLALCALHAMAEDGVSADAILLGQTGAASGPLSQLNGEYLGGAKLYFDAVNRSGGVYGRQIRVNSLDDVYDPTRAVGNAERLISLDKVFALFACFGTGPSMKVLPIATKAGVPFFAPYTGADGLRDAANRRAIHIRASYGQEITKIVDHLTGLGVTAIAVVHHADPFGSAGLDAARQALQRKGLKPMLAVAIQSGGQDAAEVARQIARANPAAVVMVTAGASSVALIRAIGASGTQPMLYGLSVISSNQLISDLGPLAHGLVVSQVVPSPYRFEAPIANEFRDAAARAGVSLSYTGLEGYIAAKVFVEALKRAGKELTRERLLDSIDAIKSYDAGGFVVAFGGGRQSGSDYVDLSVISRGRFTQ